MSIVITEDEAREIFYDCKYEDIVAAGGGRFADFDNVIFERDGLYYQFTISTGKTEMQDIDLLEQYYGCHIICPEVKKVPIEAYRWELVK
ncbi:HNH endonuclease [Rhodobacteraceae phage LS06-2018-MD06]|jgi:hypothetical protein|nr:HNH endonuclease [Rhodobacteraceae phage LS06-2018-MD06]